MKRAIFALLARALKSRKPTWGALHKDLKKNEAQRLWASGPYFTFTPLQHSFFQRHQKRQQIPKVLSKEPISRDGKYLFIFDVSGILIGYFSYGKFKPPLHVDLPCRLNSTEKRIYGYSDGGRSLQVITHLVYDKGLPRERYSLNKLGFHEHWVYHYTGRKITAVTRSYIQNGMKKWETGRSSMKHPKPAWLEKQSLND